MCLSCNVTTYGFDIGFEGKSYKLIYPKNIWQAYPGKVKGALVDNLTFLLTMNMPIVSEKNSLEYDTGVPLFKSLFEKIVAGGIPGAVDGFGFATADVLKRLENMKYRFKSSQIKIPCYRGDITNRAVVSFSSGKESLLSAAIAKEIGLNPVLVYVNDTVSPSENKIKSSFIKKLADEQKLEYVVIRNEVEQLNDFETWKKPESCLPYTHMVTSFCFTALPIAHSFQAKYILIGNERNMDYTFRNHDGIETCPSFDQTKKTMIEQNFMIKTMTGSKALMASFVKPLTTLGVAKVLFERYPEFAKYLVSCSGLDASKEGRWCGECSDCASMYLYMMAFNQNPKKFGFAKNMFGKEMQDLYSVFNGTKIDGFDKSKESRDEQLLAFYLAYKNGAKGYLMDLFKKDLLKEAKSRENKLIKEHLKVGEKSAIPKELQKGVFSIFEEELN